MVCDVVQLMVRDGDDSAGARRARVTRRRRRRGRQLPSRRRHRRPRRLVRLSVPSKTNKLRLSRDNIQLHPLTSDSSSVPRVNGAQYVSQVPGAAHYVMMPAGYRLDTGSLASPVIIQPLSSSTFDSRLGLVSTSPEVIGLADRKATPSIETNYASDGELVFHTARPHRQHSSCPPSTHRQHCNTPNTAASPYSQSNLHHPQVVWK